MHWFSPFFYMEKKFGSTEKKIKKVDFNRDEISQQSCGLYTFWPEKELRNCDRGESKTSWLETKKIQIKLSTTYKNNEQQQYAKNNDEW